MIFKNKSSAYEASRAAQRVHPWLCYPPKSAQSPSAAKRSVRVGSAAEPLRGV